MASLRLEPRPWDEADAEEAHQARNLKFRLLLSKEQGHDTLGITLKWQEIEVEPVEGSGNLVDGGEDESQNLSLQTLSTVSS